MLRSSFTLVCLSAVTLTLGAAAGCSSDDEAVTPEPASTGGSSGSGGSSTGGAAGAAAGHSGSSGAAAGGKSGASGSTATGGSSGTSGGGSGGVAGTAGNGGASVGGAGAGGGTAGAAGSSGVAGAAGADAGGAAGASTGGSAGASIGGSAGSGGANVATNVLYIESNDPTSANSNQILAYTRSADGTLTALGSGYLTGGQGYQNMTQGLGPDDSDQELVTNAAHTLLFAVNQGSDTIAVFSIAADGTLSAVAGSPFASGGHNPVSVGYWTDPAGTQDRLYVVNQASDGSTAPNYTGMNVGADGKLTPIAGSTMTTVTGGVPTQAILSYDGKHLFGTDFLAPAATTPHGSLRSLLIGADGTLSSSPTDPLAIPDDANFPPAMHPPVALNGWLHPTKQVLYTTFPTRSEVGVYTFADDGSLTYVAAAPVTGKAPCWVRLSKDGAYLFTTDTGSSIISTLSVDAAGTKLAEIHTSAMLLDATTGIPFTDGMGKTQTMTNNPYEEELSPDGMHLYVISQRVSTNATDATATSVLHTLDVAADGSVTEKSTDIKLPVPLTARPQGIVVL